MRDRIKLRSWPMRPLVVLLLLASSVHGLSRVSMTEDGGNANIVIKIRKEVSEDDCPDILRGIKVMILEEYFEALLQNLSTLRIYLCRPHLLNHKYCIHKSSVKPLNSLKDSAFFITIFLSQNVYFHRGSFLPIYSLVLTLEVILLILMKNFLFGPYHSFWKQKVQACFLNYSSLFFIIREKLLWKYF
jgi:hypothetical protein